MRAGFAAVEAGGPEIESGPHHVQVFRVDDRVPPPGVLPGVPVHPGVDEMDDAKEVVELVIDLLAVIDKIDAKHARAVEQIDDVGAEVAALERGV